MGMRPSGVFHSSSKRSGRQLTSQQDDRTTKLSAQLHTLEIGRRTVVALPSVTRSAATPHQRAAAPTFQFYPAHWGAAAYVASAALLLNEGYPIFGPLQRGIAVMLTATFGLLVWSHL